ncbi:MAG: hypothetical protein IKP03_10900 [Fibrobacter sp.]|nr:hypothetical protein [Fibrobacter sp.]
MSFTPIETQEQFDAAIKDRLTRDREAYAKRFEGFKSPEDVQAITDQLNSKIKSLEDAAAATQAVIAEKDAKIAEGETYRTDLEKTRIAVAAGLDMKYAKRLNGSTAEEWKKDAEELAKDFRTAHTFPPLGNPEPSGSGKATRTQFADWLKEQIS